MIVHILFKSLFTELAFLIKKLILNLKKKKDKEKHFLFLPQSWTSKGEEIQGVSDIAFRCVVLACVLTDLFKKQSLKNALCASEVTS